MSNISRRDKILFSLQCLSVSLFIYTLSFDLFQPYAYIGLSAVITSLLIFSIMTYHNKWVPLVQILVLFILLRNIYYIATNFSVFPFWDAYWDYATTRVFLEASQIFVIDLPDIGLSRQLIFASRWPLLHTLTYMLVKVTGLPLFFTSLMITNGLLVILFLFTVLITKCCMHAFKLNDSIILIALLIFTTIPDTFFWFMFYKYQTLAICFIFMIIFLIQKYTLRLDTKMLSLVILLLIATVTAHHVATTIMELYFILLFFVFLSYHVFSKYILKSNYENKKHAIFLYLAVMLGAMIYLWWSIIGEIIFTDIGSVGYKLIETLKDISNIESNPIFISYAPELTPLWAMILLKIRDISIYLPMVIGLFLLFIKSRFSISFQKLFVILSAFSLLGIYSLNFIIRYAGVSRTLLYAMPLVIFPAAFFYEKLGGIKVIQKNLGKVIKITLLSIIVFSSFIGLWGHNFIPLHLYDSTLNQENIGEHNEKAIRVQSFLSAINFDAIGKIYSDDYGVLLQMIPTTQYNKLERLENIKIDGRNQLVIELCEGNTFHYFAVPGYATYNPQYSSKLASEKIQQIDSIVGQKYSNIFNDGEFTIHYRN